MLSLRPVEQHEAGPLYRLMRRDFIRNERFPMQSLKRGLQNGHLRAFYLANGDSDLGYAVCALPVGHAVVHIQYFAVLPEHRNQGNGKAFLALLRERFVGYDLILECEDPHAARTGQDYRMRTKRIAFYLRAGFRILENVRLNLFGVRMLCLTSSEHPIPDPEALWKLCYEPLFPLDFMERYVRMLDTPDSGNGPVLPGRYRHFKGGNYEVLFCARHSETQEAMVVYRPLGKHIYWLRPAKMWNEKVWHEGRLRRRFVYLGR